MAKNISRAAQCLWGAEQLVGIPTFQNRPMALHTGLSLRLHLAASPAPPHHTPTRVVTTACASVAVATASTSGQVILWGAPEDTTDLRPRVLLLGHTAPVVWLSCCIFERSDAIVSVCGRGFANVWDPMDGRCLSSASDAILGGARATAAAMLPQLTHAVDGGECLRLCVVELNCMSVSVELAPVRADPVPAGPCRLLTGARVAARCAAVRRLDHRTGRGRRRGARYSHKPRSGRLAPLLAARLAGWRGCDGAAHPGWRDSRVSAGPHARRPLAARGAALR